MSNYIAKPHFLILSFAGVNILCGLLLIYFQARMVTALLLLLVIPVVYASLFYTRPVYITMSVIIILNGVVITFFVARDILASLTTVSILGISILGINETLYLLAKQQRRTQRALYISQSKYRQLIEQVPAIISQTETGVRPKTLYINSQIEKILGFTPQEWLSDYEHWTKQIYPDDRERIINEIALCTRTNQPFRAEYRLVRKDGQVIWVYNEAIPITDEKGKTRLFQGLILDITRQKAAELELATQKELLVQERLQREEELIRTAKLESLGVMAGGIAHDFNNLLTTIMGNISFVQTRQPEPEVLEALKESEKAVEQARRLSLQLLTFAKGGEPVKSITVIPQLIKEAAQLALSGTSIQYRTVCADNLALSDVDHTQLIQVFQNLFINAVQAMPEGGEIQVSLNNATTTDIEKTPLPSGDYLKIAVSDTGVGVPTENLGKIFDPYFTTKPGGSGLGLATCYSIIKRHGGYLNVESKASVGTTFFVYLPATIGAPKTTNVITTTKESFRGVKEARILVMDDDQAICRLLKRLLPRMDYDMVATNEGEEALACYQEALMGGIPFDLVIMDLTIPAGKGGKEIIGELLAIDPQATAIVSSGYSDDPVMANYQHYGFKGVLRKPYNFSELENALTTVLDNRVTINR